MSFTFLQMSFKNLLAFNFLANSFSKYQRCWCISRKIHSTVRVDTIGSFSKTRRRRQRERRQTKGLISKTIAVHVRFESLYIALPSSTNQQRELTTFYVFWRTRTAMANFSHLLSELNAFGACLACVSF